MIINTTVVYGSNRKADREMLWDELVEIKSRIGEEAWIIMGDFNEVRDLTEREGEGEFDEDGAKKFNDAIERIEAVELTTMGGQFTWSNCSRRGRLV